MISSVLEFLLTGKDEEQKQAGSSSPGHHQRVGDACGRADQRRGPGVAPHHSQEVGGVPQELHPGETLAAAPMWIDLFLFAQQFTGASSRFVPCERSFRRRIRTKASLPCSRRARAVLRWRAPSFHSLAHFINPTALVCLPSQRLRLVSSPQSQ